MSTLQAPSSDSKVLDSATLAPSSGDGGDVVAPARDRRAISRRALLRNVSGFAAMWGAAAAPRQSAASEVTADVDPGSLLSKLIQRISFGYSEAEMTLASSMGYSGYLEYHLNHMAIDDSALNGMLAPLTTLTMIPQQLFPLAAGQVVSELQSAAVLRAVFTKRQLFERVVEFWTDHFNIDINNGDDRYLKTVDDRDVIRANALGTFGALLDASMHSPAMLLYLDNNVSRVGAINENYGRELMELHTLGVDGGYTQQDVIEVARCLTGWQYFGRTDTPTAGTFRFNAGQHDNGQKTVLGNIIPAGGGINDGITVRNILINHPSTAKFVAKKMCRRFLGESVPQAIIDDVAATYTSSGGDIKSMIRTMLKPNYLYDAAPRYKRPFHHFASAMRALPTTITNTAGIRTNLSSAGHSPFIWTAPDGYPDNLDYWIGLVLPRWNFGASLMNGTTGSIAGATVSDSTFFSGLTSADQMADKINTAMFAGAMPQADRDRIRDYMLPNPPSQTRRREAIGLAIGSPAFQWY